MKRRTDDPRTAAEKKADAEFEAAFLRGAFPPGAAKDRLSSVERARRKKQARRAAAQLGVGLARLRRAFGLSQMAVARHVGTQRSAISRIESGNYGGLTIERFLLLLATIRDLGAAGVGEKPSRGEGS